MSKDTDWKSVRILMESMIDALEAIDNTITDDAARQLPIHGPLRPGTVMELVWSASTIARDLKYQIVQTASYPTTTKYLRHDLRSIFVQVAEAASELIGYDATVGEDGLPTSAAIKTETEVASLSKFLSDIVPKAMSKVSQSGHGLISGTA
jgi:hypothetical protein